MTDDSILQRDGHDDDKEGFCRRRAPLPMMGGVQLEFLKYITMIAWHLVSDEDEQKEFKGWEDRALYSEAYWPTTKGDDWCGEFKHAET